MPHMPHLQGKKLSLQKITFDDHDHHIIACLRELRRPFTYFLLWKPLFFIIQHLTHKQEQQQTSQLKLVLMNHKHRRRYDVSYTK